MNTILFIQDSDRSHPEALNILINRLPVLPDSSHEKYDEVLKSLIIETKIREYQKMSLEQIKYAFNVTIETKPGSKIIKQLTINR